MKTLLSFVLTFCFFSSLNAQDLLLSEDFDYPIGADLNQHNWKPLTYATDNPIKIINGLNMKGYPASGGAANLGKSGQDVIRPFSSVEDGTLHLSVQLNIQKAFQKLLSYSQFVEKQAPPSPSNYFMFLSSKEEPNKPLLKFSIVNHEVSYGFPVVYHYMTIYALNAENEVIGFVVADHYKRSILLQISYTIQGEYKGHLKMEIDELINFLDPSTVPDGHIQPVYQKKSNGRNRLNISNLSNIVLSQSDRTLGSDLAVDRIRIAKKIGLVVPCLDFYKSHGVQFCYPTQFGVTCGPFLDHEGIVLEGELNQKFPSFSFSFQPIFNEATIEAPEGFLVSVNDESPKKKSIIPLKIDAKQWENYFEPLISHGNRYMSSKITVFLVGDSKIGSSEVLTNATPSLFKDKLKIKIVGSDCSILELDLKGTIKSRTFSNNSSFDVSFFPNSTNGDLNLRINNQETEGVFDFVLTDNQGKSLFQKKGEWQNVKPEIEQILGKQQAGQFFFSVKREDSIKTIRVFLEK